jgi:hypothetical protein
MIAPRSSFAGAVLENGQVLVTGGWSVNTTVLSSAELYAPPQDRWSPAGSMSKVRTGHQAARLPDGRVLVTGGWSTDLAWNDQTTEIYTPVTTISAPAEASTGRQALATAGAPVPVTVVNAGDSRMRIDGTAVGGAQAAEFAVGDDGCAGRWIVPGGSCTISVRFTPRGVGPRAAELTFAANTATSQHVIRLAGTGYRPEDEPPPVETPTPVETTAPPAPVPSPTPVPTPKRPAKSARVAVPFKSSFKPPPGLSRAKACRGRVSLQLRAGSKVIATKTTKLDRRCRYAATFKITRSRTGGRTTLRVRARFEGNRYLAPTRAVYQVRVPA